MVVMILYHQVPLGVVTHNFVGPAQVVSMILHDQKLSAQLQFFPVNPDSDSAVSEHINGGGVSVQVPEPDTPFPHCLRSHAGPISYDPIGDFSLGCPFLQYM